MNRDAIFSLGSWGARVPLPAGKVPPDILADLLRIPRGDSPDVLIPPTVGEDAAVVRIGDGLVAIATDPITFPTSRPGLFSVCVNANDLAVTGARPAFFTLTMLLPVGTCAEEIAAMIKDAVSAGDACGAVLIGGHTEMTDAVTRPVLSVTMFGELVTEEPLRTGGACAGDALIQVNPLAIEGTAILAEMHHADLLSVLGEEGTAKAVSLVYDPGLSVVEAALSVADLPGVHAMHDPTEGGLATGAREMAEASGVGLSVVHSSLLMLDVTESVCRVAGCDPLGLISSGCLLISTSQEAVEEVLRVVQAGGRREAAVIGQFTTESDLVLVDRAGQAGALPVFEVDQLAMEPRKQVT
ncbi:MAG: hydrogenase expression protein [Lentisphaeria bacterium]|nr:hydrogenase expression protein [Lentisphaeria bacterium]